MRTHVLGGGPAGLYFAILYKKANPTADVRVIERNAADDTFGWGVVFSDETMAHLVEADRESWDAVTRRFARWDAIDIRVRGTTIRSGGHGFCGISRKHLLEILQGRARELGVDVRHKTDILDVESLRDCDLLVAADGVNGLCRKQWADRFGPSVQMGRAHYMWLGTQQKFEAFTFSFRESEHGVFQVHAYQFEPETSTFIVECDDETWRNAGLDAADEAASIAYCERLFADDLGGHRLLGNRSRWIQFPTVHNDRWWFDNVVLIGDAAHTAHFSIGSGTKMAMEDAIALAACLAEHSERAAALAAYEEERRPEISRIQRAASQSQDWFEHVRRHVRLPPEQLAFSLLTRTRRVTHDNLRMRDAAYIEAVDRWWMRSQGLEEVASDPDHPIVPPMFTPFDLRGVRLDNRVVVSAMCQYSAVDGIPNDWHLVHLGSRAMGGAALVFAEMTDVSAEGRISPGCTGLWSDAHRAAWARIVDFVHGHTRAKIGIQIGHAGRKGSTKRLWEGEDEPLDSGNWPLLAPSAVAWSRDNQLPREMTREDMRAVREEHVRAARFAREAGFDVLELHAAHGYLLSSFLTPLSNQRTDEYGGPLANRARYPLEVLDAIRDVWGDRPLSVRISATDWVAGGFGVDDAVEVAAMLKEHGADVIDVSAGQTSTEAKPIYGRAFQTPFSERIRNEVGVPTITVGNIWSPDMVNTILLAGRADLVALARAHLVDPYWTIHAATEQGYEVDWPSQYRSARAIARKMYEE